MLCRREWLTLAVLFFILVRLWIFREVFSDCGSAEFWDRMELDMEKATADIGLIGLAVMGQNLVLNMEDHGFEVVVYNRTISKTKAFLEREGTGRKISGASDIPELVAVKLAPPCLTRKFMPPGRMPCRKK